jgi:hypothetical protein
MKWLGNKCCLRRVIMRDTLESNSQRRMHLDCWTLRGEGKMILKNDAKYLPTHTA